MAIRVGCLWKVEGRDLKRRERTIIYRPAENYYKADIIQMAIRLGKLREPKITSAFRDKTSPPPTASQNKSGTKQQLNDVSLVPTLKVLEIFYSGSFLKKYGQRRNTGIPAKLRALYRRKHGPNSSFCFKKKA